MWVSLSHSVYFPKKTYFEQLYVRLFSTAYFGDYQAIIKQFTVTYKVKYIAVEASL